MPDLACKCHWCGTDLVRKKQAVNVRRHFCNLSCKGEWQRTQKPVTRDWLVKHYIDKQLDTTQIGRIVGRDPKSVWNWLKDFDIPRRTRGSGSVVNRFQRGHKLGIGRKLSDETKAKIRAAAIADGRVPFDRAVGPNGGRRGHDHPSWKGGITPERQAFYQTKEWKQAERIVKKRDRNTCQRCGRVKIKGDRVPFDIHHIVGFACVGLRAVASNLVYLCERCHYWVHGAENVTKDFIKEN